MKNIVLYANCQGIGLQYFLKLSSDIKKVYNIYHIRIDKLVFKEEDINFQLIKDADIFIYQHLKDKHDIINTNNIISYLKPNCIKISFPYIYNNAFYPFKGPLNLEKSHLSKDTSIIFNNSKSITDLIDDNLSLDQIIELFNNNKINYNYNERFKQTMNLLKENEENCNIKVSKFIETNFSKTRLFLLENHPTSLVFLEVVNNILEILNFNKLNIKIGLNDAGLPGGILPIHNSVVRDLDLNYKEDYNSYEYYKHILKNIYHFYLYKKQINNSQNLP